MKFLPEILALQRDLVTRFQNVPEAAYQSIGDFINSHSSGRTLLSQEVRTPVFGGSRITSVGGDQLRGGQFGATGHFSHEAGATTNPRTRQRLCYSLALLPKLSHGAHRAFGALWDRECVATRA